MQRRTRFWAIMGLVVLVLAAVLWRFAINRSSSNPPTATAAIAPREPAYEPIPALGPHNFARQTPLPPIDPPAKSTNFSHNEPLLAYRLKNTEKPIKELVYMDSAILLRNALFDAAELAPLEIPPQLKAQGDPGSYVIQARGAIDARFLAQLKAVGAEVISYIPNNAYLVRAPEAAANRLRSAPETLAVLPWEPYFKLDLALLARVMNEEPLPTGERVSVVVFPGQREAGIKAVEELGAHVFGEDTSPFGHQIIVQPRPDSLVALAQLPLVQSIEPHRGRRLMNDISRVRASVATNTVTATPNYLGLTGSNVVVNVNDTGVEDAHPDLTGRIFGDPGIKFDNNGHGTHVGGTIASSGVNSPPNAPGSTNGATFRGIAPDASLYAQRINLLTGPLISDAVLQQNVGSSNVFISNNSWAYPLSEYNQNAASYDAAVRDALPGVSGSSPVIFVFAAGNVDNSDYDGGGTSPDQIMTPGTAKNVITVGAIENLRRLTNTFVMGGQTNAYFERETDSDSQVAFYSARGNVGVGIEGEFGRFKPDVVAPGSWLISTRSSQWRDPTNLVSADPSRLVDQFVERRGTNFYFRTVPDNATMLIIQLLRNSQSPATMPTLNIYTNLGVPPPVDAAHYAGDNQLRVEPVEQGQFWFAVVNTNRVGVHFDLLTIVISTNDFGEYFDALKMLNDTLAPYYRFESGTSMAAPVVSGTLALMQQFFEQRRGYTNSPALMKALLINGARSLACNGCDYDLQVNKAVNSQGWGLIHLSNSIPSAVNGPVSNEWPIIMFDQDPKNALATGESHTYEVELRTRARFESLMITLVWTDPPGNPVVSTKLVNDLDLVVTNLDTGDYFIGNNFPQGSDFTQPVFFGESNAPPFDVINNVENVFVPDTDILALRYSVTVRARRVNVNAVNAQTNGIRQDYALVISSGNSALTNTFASPALSLVKAFDGNPYLRNLTNKVPLLNERVGANSPQLNVVSNNVPGPSDGVLSQWNFYVFNNTNASHTNIAFFTFLSPDLSLPRYREADIDLYVSRDPNLTNLNPAVLAACRKSLTRGGTELVILTGADAPVGAYYVAVKSEDQQAASYAIFAIAQENPFGERDENGNIPLDFFFADPCIPDGSPERPGGARFFSIVADPANVRRIVLTNTIDHDLGGDLLGTLTSSGGSAGIPPTAVLNNHRQFGGIQTFIYDDSGEDDIPGSRTSDGPGTLRDFEGQPAFGLWQFVMVDNAPFHTGCVTQIVGLIEPQDDTNTMGDGILLTVAGGKWRYTSLDVPVGVTNLQVFIRHEGGAAGPLDVYIRRNARPTLTDYDKYGRVDPPGGMVSLGRGDFPSLQSGRYHIGIHNPNAGAISFRLRIEFQYSLLPVQTVTYTSTNTPIRIPDNLTTNLVIGVTNAATVADVKVGVRMDHDRLSDVVLHLVSPEGTRILLTENRGLLQATNYGEGVPINFIVPVSADGGKAESRTNINTFNRQGVIRINYNFLNIPDNLRVYYEGRRIFDSGMVNLTGTFTIPYGPGISTFVEIVVNEGSQTADTFWNMTISITGPWNYAVFTDQTTLGPPIKFAFPPFSRLPTTNTVFSNSFENVLAGIYPTNPTPPAVTTVDNWAVRSNAVAIFTDVTTNAACDGTNFLALSHGMISRGITNLVPGHEYILNFGHRKVSSSPTQSVTVPVSLRATPYANLTSPPPVSAILAMPVPKLRLCPGQDVTVISTNEVDIGGTLYTAQGDTNATDVYGFPRYGLIGCWSSHPTDLRPATRAAGPFYIGFGPTNVIAAPNEPGDYYLFVGVNRDDYAAPPPTTNAFAVDFRWAQCQLSSADYLLGTSPTRLQGTWRTNWAAESLLFMANPTTTNVGFRADHNSTILLDAILIDEIVPGAYFLSEEPLAPLKGQTAYGEWKLEVTDNRAGPVIAGTNGPTVLSWSLNFIFADGPAPIPLVNGMPYNGTVRRDELVYFVVSVPSEVNTNRQRVISTGPGIGGVELLYSPFGLPEGEMPPDPVLPIPDGFWFGVSSNFPAGAALIPGRQYFLAVRNVDPAEVNNFQIYVEFMNVPITPLPHATPIPNTINPSPAGFLQTRNDSSLAVQNMHYYYYDVGSSGDAAITNLYFQLNSTAGRDVHLVARRALPVADLFPRPTFFEYQSTEPIGADTIIITSNSIPVKLAPGRWYLGVYNTGTNQVNYSIVAHESRNPLFNLNYLDVGPGDAVVTNFTVAPNNVLLSFYHFITHQNNAAVLFEIFDMNGDVDLIVRRGDLPSRDLYDFSFLNPRFGPLNAGYEPIPIRTNVFVPTLGVSTNWYLGLVNRGFNTSTGMLCVKVFTNINPLVGCVFNGYFGSVIGTNVNICWTSVAGNTYDIESTTDLITWIPILTNEPAAPPQNCVTIPAAAPSNGLHFYRIRAN